MFFFLNYKVCWYASKTSALSIRAPNSLPHFCNIKKTLIIFSFARKDSFVQTTRRCASTVITYAMDIRIAMTRLMKTHNDVRRKMEVDY